MALGPLERLGAQVLEEDKVLVEDQGLQAAQVGLVGLVVQVLLAEPAIAVLQVVQAVQAVRGALEVPVVQGAMLLPLLY